MEITNQTVRFTIDSQVRQRPAEIMTALQQWLQHPERFWVRKALLQIHLWVGAGAGLYVILMSLTGSIIVFRNELSGWFLIEWLVKLHENLLIGEKGRLVNGIGAIAVTTVCLTGAIIWWPGLKNWRRSLKLRWGSRLARLNWDAHRALGVWCFVFVLMWGISGLYFSFPQAFYAPASLVDPADKYTDTILFGLSQLHFGRFGWYIEALWAVLGLVPAILAFTGAFVCCRRMIYQLFLSGQDNRIRQQNSRDIIIGRQAEAITHRSVVEQRRRRVMGYRPANSG